MNILLMFITTILLSSCANSGPQMIGKDSYLVSARVPFSGQTGAKTEALATANSHCTQLGKHLMLNHITSSECALHGGCGEAEVTYFCLDENDPRFKLTQMRKEPDSVIQIQTQ